jgi:acyl dehydratase
MKVYKALPFMQFKDNEFYALPDSQIKPIFTPIKILKADQMNKLTIGSFKEFETYVGKDLGTSDYLKISQEQINLFAEATIDHQWIHTNPEKAATESPFKTTIAHGYLTVSLMPYFWAQIADFKNVKLMVNYGIENLKFNQAVLVNSELRMRAKLVSLKDLRGTTKAQLKIVVEIKDNPKPALEADIIFLYHFH